MTVCQICLSLCHLLQNTLLMTSHGCDKVKYICSYDFKKIAYINVWYEIGINGISAYFYSDSSLQDINININININIIDNHEVTTCQSKAREKIRILYGHRLLI